ncbi:MAG TPA: UbiA family prenyltransferase [Candidatus Deferrimicrobium sp.]|nr:UbiA family prenyltransferase [Candidatus Deferrimicrobium sp.]
MKVKSFFVISRWEYLPSAINEVGIPALLALAAVPFSSYFLAMAAAGLWVWWGGHFIGSHINCLADYEVDKLYKKYLAAAVDDIGKTTIKKIIRYESIFISLAIFTAAVAFKRPMLAIFWLSGLFLAFAYSCKPLHFKSRRLMNPLTLGLVLYICPMFFVYHLITLSFSIFSTIIILLFTFQMVPMFLMDEISDYEEDKQCGLRNPCVFYGRKKVISWSLVIYFCATVGTAGYIILKYGLNNLLSRLIFLGAVLFFGFVLLDFYRLYRLASQYETTGAEEVLSKLKKSVITPVWLMGSGTATLLLLFISPGR